MLGVLGTGGAYAGAGWRPRRPPAEASRPAERSAARRARQRRWPSCQEDIVRAWLLVASIGLLAAACAPGAAPAAQPAPAPPAAQAAAPGSAAGQTAPGSPAAPAAPPAVPA